MAIRPSVPNVATCRVSKASISALFLLSITTFSVSAQVNSGSTYDLVIQGSRCAQSTVPYQSSAQLECSYKVGTGLRFTIAGVGQDDAAITVDHADGLDSDFYFTFGIMHGCVIVKRGFLKQPPELRGGLPGFDMAFVSPRTGRVYKTWEECGQVRARRPK